METFHNIDLKVAYDDREDCQEIEHECPVCYECLLGTERTLICGHVFCHDCLVKSLVSIKSDGQVRDTIICPICRHLTFIRKQKGPLVSFAADKTPHEDQTLEVPLPPGQLPSKRRVPWPTGVGWIARCFGRISKRARRQAQIFIISAEGRPMEEEDMRVVIIPGQPQPQLRPSRRLCTTAFLVFLLLLCALFALTMLFLLLRA